MLCQDRSGSWQSFAMGGLGAWRSFAKPPAAHGKALPWAAWVLGKALPSRLPPNGAAELVCSDADVAAEEEEEEEEEVEGEDEGEGGEEREDEEETEAEEEEESGGVFGNVLPRPQRFLAKFCHGRPACLAKLCQAPRRPWQSFAMGGLGACKALPSRLPPVGAAEFVCSDADVAAEEEDQGGGGGGGCGGGGGGGG